MNTIAVVVFVVICMPLAVYVATELWDEYYYRRGNRKVSKPITVTETPFTPCVPIERQWTYDELLELFDDSSNVVKPLVLRCQKYEDILSRMIDLFNAKAEFFGLNNAEFPTMQPEDEQCEFELKFRELICDYSGHDIGPDQCGKPEHEYCYRCHKLRTELEAQ